MKKIIFYNISMKENVSRCQYVSDDLSLPVSDSLVRYPMNAMLEKTLNESDDITAILLVKKDENGYYKKNVSACVEELLGVAEKTKATIDYKIIDTEFSQDQSIHDQLLLSIVGEIETGVHIAADITYGPKDLPIVLFTALNFAEKFLDGEIDNIVYGQATFVDGKPVNTKICDMSPLYYLNSVTNTVQCTSPEDAKKMLKSLLDF